MADVTEVAVPDIGDFTDVPIIEVLVAPGDTVAVEDPLITLESDKATMEVPSPVAGVVAELRVSVGDTVSEGSPILTLTPADANGGGGAAPVEDVKQAAEGAAPAGAGTDMDEGAEAVAAVDAAIAAEKPPPEPSGDGAATAPSGDGAAPPADVATRSGDAPVYASPSVRRLARELGVQLSRVSGTGRKGRVTTDDVHAFASGDVAQEDPEVPAPAAAGDGDGGLGLAPWPKVDFAKFGEVERVPLSRIQRISGPNLARNWVRIPHVTQFEDADITDLEAFRKRINAEQDAKVTMVALLIKAVIASLRAHPQVNSSLDGEELVLKRYYHIGFAADTPQGLVVPVIKDADRKGLLEIASELRALSGKARDGKLTMGDMQGGTFSISSLGGIGGTAFTPIVNAPEVAILGVSKSVTKPVWDGGQFVPRLIVPLSLSYDHRVIDGALAARFCVHLAGVLSDLRRVLL